MAKFNNKYRIESTRLKNWDYGNNGLYFITICTAHRNWWFGEIKNGDPCVQTPNMGVCGTNDDPHNNRTHESQGGRDAQIGRLYPPAKNAANMKNVNPIKTIIRTDDATPDSINRQRTYNASQKWKPETLGGYHQTI